jgi:NADPH-dependent ferric siderophore reductase
MTMPVPLRRRSGPLSAQVTAVETPTPKLRRVHLSCPDLASGRLPDPGCWVRAYFPVPDAEGPASDLAARAYTVCRHTPEAGTFFIDFVLHGGGPAATWAASARPGDRLALNGPLGRTGLGPAWRRYVFLADPTALPAVREMMSALPPGAQATAHLWVPEASERLDFAVPAGSTATWHVAPFDPAALASASALFPEGWTPGDPTLRVWLAGEAAQVAAARRALEPLAFPPGCLHAAGYWRQGHHSDPQPIH